MNKKINLKNGKYWMSVPTLEIKKSVHEKLKELGIEATYDADRIKCIGICYGSLGHNEDRYQWYIDEGYQFLSIHDLFYNCENKVEEKVKTKFGDVSLSTIEKALKKYFNDLGKLGIK